MSDLSYRPQDWYWLAEDGRVFASARHLIVNQTDTAFKERQAAGQFTLWPRDASGAQTDAALDAVLAPHGMAISGVLPAKFSFLEFMDLFTEAEQLAIAGAAMTDVPTKLWYDRAVGAQFIDLSDPRLTAGLQALVTANLLTSARRNRVLAGLAPQG